MVTCIFINGFAVASCKFKGSWGRLCMLRVRVARPFVGVRFRAPCFFSPGRELTRWHWGLERCSIPELRNRT